MKKRLGGRTGVLPVHQKELGLDRSNGNRAGVVFQLVQDGGGNPYL